MKTNKISSTKYQVSGWEPMELMICTKSDFSKLSKKKYVNAQTLKDISKNWCQRCGIPIAGRYSKKGFRYRVYQVFGQV